MGKVAEPTMKEQDLEILYSFSHRVLMRQWGPQGLTRYRKGNSTPRFSYQDTASKEDHNE